VAPQDVQILNRAEQLLSNEEAWNRADNRDCPKDAERMSLFCALQQASIELLGSYDHRRAALQEVRFVIDERGRSYDHRLMGFNNDPSTTLSDVRRVLEAARARVQKRLAAEAAKPPTATP
jgi:hypothetical protein